MKRVVILVSFVALIITILISTSDYKKLVTVKTGNTSKQPLQIDINNTQDADCGMIIYSLPHSSQVIAPDGKTWFFHDIGGMVHWLKDKEFAKDAVIWVYTLDTQKWIDGKIAYYSLTDKTPMNNGFGAYENNNPKYVSYEEMSLKMLRGENLNNPQIRKQLLNADK